MAGRLLHEIRSRLKFLIDVGLQYLTLDRLASTLSGGESQRIQLATNLGSALVGALYVLDEPSIGLHARDNKRLIKILEDLRDIGNTVLVVEHEPSMMTAADKIIDIGPGAGELGGEVVFSGSPKEMLSTSTSLTAKYLRGEVEIKPPRTRKQPGPRRLQIRAASEHNLKGIDVDIPLGMTVCIAGVSGSGKSTLVHDIIYAGLKKLRGEWTGYVGSFGKLEGAQFVDDVVLVDQSPIGRTPRSIPSPTSKSTTPSETCMHLLERRRAAASMRPISASMYRVVGVNAAKEMGSRSKRCSSSPTSNSFVRSAKEQDSSRAFWR